MKHPRAIALAFTSAVLLASQAGAAHADDDHDSAASVTAPARSATAKYHSVNAARRLAIRSWPIPRGSPALRSRRWVPWECTTSTVIW
jgi:hypothetical protein